MRPSLFTNSILEFYSQNTFCGEHEVVFYLYKSESSPLRKDLSLCQREFSVSGIKDILDFLNYIEKYDFIVFHSLFFDAKLKMLLCLKRALLKKIVWIEFGADLYSWKAQGGIKAVINNCVDTFLRNNFGYFVGIFPPDCDVFNKEFPKHKARVFYAPYIGATVDEEFNNYSFNSSLDSHIRNNEDIIIQIGHNAFKTLNHIAVLTKLQFLKERKVKFLLPLSYGDKMYGDSVQKYAEKIFPGQVYCLREILPKEKYFEIINNVDIAIFNTYRQAGLGNINRLILKNTKVYLPCESVMYKYFSSKGVSVYSYDDILDKGDKQLLSPVETCIRENNMRYIQELKDVEKGAGYWREIFLELSKSI